MGCCGLTDLGWSEEDRRSEWIALSDAVSFGGCAVLESERGGELRGHIILWSAFNWVQFVLAGSLS